MKMEILVEKVQLNHDVCKSLLLLKAFYIAFYPYALFSKKKSLEFLQIIICGHFENSCYT